MSRNQNSMPTRPRYFQISIFSYLLCAFLDPSRFYLISKYLHTPGFTYCHMIIQTSMQYLVLHLVIHILFVSHRSATLSIRICSHSFRIQLVSNMHRTNKKWSLNVCIYFYMLFSQIRMGWTTWHMKPLSVIFIISTTYAWFSKMWNFIETLVW